MKDQTAVHLAALAEVAESPDYHRLQPHETDALAYVIRMVQQLDQHDAMAHERVLDIERAVLALAAVTQRLAVATPLIPEDIQMALCRAARAAVVQLEGAPPIDPPVPPEPKAPRKPRKKAKT